MKAIENLIITNKTSSPIKEELFYDIYETILNAEEHPKQKEIINLLFTNDEEMKEFNGKFRKIDAITDVLSFEDNLPFSPVLGDIIIDVLQADRQKVSTLNEELQMLFIHGVLHLLGYEHLTKKDEYIMKNKEKKYFSLIRSKTNRGL